MNEWSTPSHKSSASRVFHRSLSWGFHCPPSLISSIQSHVPLESCISNPFPPFPSLPFTAFSLLSFYLRFYSLYTPSLPLLVHDWLTAHLSVCLPVSLSVAISLILWALLQYLCILSMCLTVLLPFILSLVCLQSLLDMPVCLVSDVYLSMCLSLHPFVFSLSLCHQAERRAHRLYYYRRKFLRRPIIRIMTTIYMAS